MNTSIIKKKVILAIPGDNFSSKFVLSLVNTALALWTSEKYDFMIAQGTGSMVHFVRMQTLGLDTRRGINQKPFNGDDYDIWLTIDSDIIFGVEQIFELLESTEKYPVVSGLYKMADMHHFAAVEHWDTNYYSLNATYQFLTKDILDKWKSRSKSKFMKVNYVGMGFMAVRKEVLDKMRYPYFDGELKDSISDTGIIMRDMSSEDVCFCHNIANAGYSIFINTDLRVGHLKPFVI